MNQNQNQNGCNTQKISDGLCGVCVYLIDGRYCMAWRDLVPERIKDCEKWKDNGEPPF